MIIVYGGSFNPPTLAHQKIAEHVLKEINNSKLIFMPVGNNYAKPELIHYKFRIDMLNILVKQLSQCEVSDFEAKQPEFRGTLYTLNHIKQTNMNEEIGFLLGADNLMSLSKWINSEELLRSFRIIVLDRDDLDCDSIIKNDELLNKYRDSFIILKNFQTIEISSNEFRNDGKDAFINEAILQYIERHKLYNR